MNVPLGHLLDTFLFCMVWPETMRGQACDLFLDGEDPGFLAPFETIDTPTPSPFMLAALWLGAKVGDEVQVACQRYGRANDNFDFAVGPLSPINGEPYPEYCNPFQQIWTVTTEEIEAHIADFEHDGTVNNPSANILRWPGSTDTVNHIWSGDPNTLGSWSAYSSSFTNTGENGIGSTHLDPVDPGGFFHLSMAISFHQKSNLVLPATTYSSGVYFFLFENANGITIKKINIVNH